MYGGRQKNDSLIICKLVQQTLVRLDECHLLLGVELARDRLRLAAQIGSLKPRLVRRVIDPVDRSLIPLTLKERIAIICSSLNRLRFIIRLLDGTESTLGWIHSREPRHTSHTLLSLGTNKNAAAFEAAASSLKLVAGVGFEPTTFRL